MVYVIQVCCLQWKTPDNGQRNCPKHVEFYSKNKFDKLVHLVGFILRMYHDARSPEGQIQKKESKWFYTRYGITVCNGDVALLNCNKHMCVLLSETYHPVRHAQPTDSQATWYDVCRHIERTVPFEGNTASPGKLHQETNNITKLETK